MAYVITQSCCSDASCIPVCPVSCIRPTPGDPEFLTAEMLYIDPGTCIDCAACTEACPVGAIQHEEELPDGFVRYAAVNAEYFERNPLIPVEGATTPPAKVVPAAEPLRVAVVGSGPSGMFAAAELVARVPKGAVEVEVFDRLPTPWGLARAGVAPDHATTKEVSEVFGRIAGRPGVRLHLNVEVGRHVSHQELLDHHHAVIYATGAFDDRRLGIPGEDLAGSVTASEFVGWYNGHPDFADRRFDLSGSRAVIVGNGNVALDVARILVLDPEELARTDIADHALEVLRLSRVSEVVIVGRRGVDQAAYTNPELIALGDLPGVEVVVDAGDLETSPVVPGSDHGFTVDLRRRLLAEYAADDRRGSAAAKRIVLRHLNSPTRIVGDGRVEVVELARNELVADAAGNLIAEPTGQTDRLEASLVIRSVGFKGAPLPGVAGFDEATGRFSHRAGRALDAATGDVLPGVYATGWAKRGASGVIGTNRLCAAETVDAVLADLVSGALAAPERGGGDLVDLLGARQPDLVDRAGWRRIDANERAAGRERGRPRVKSSCIPTMVSTARAG